jgi:signal transduction histidine kinase
MRVEKKAVLALIIARLIVVTTLFIAAVVIQMSTDSFLPLGPFYTLIIGTYVLSVIYLLLHRWNAHLAFQAYAQIILDLLLITALVYISGGIGGNLYSLYIFAIVAASIVLGRRPAYLTASLAAVFFGGLADGLYFGFIPYFRPDQYQDLSVGLVLYTIFLAWAVFFVIAFLINHLTFGLKKAREALIQARRDLEIKERQAAAGLMSAQIAHEIRNPLSAISGSVQVLKNELTLDQDQSRLMEIILRESRRVSASIDQFLSLASSAPPAFSRFDLAEVLRETLTMFSMSGELDGRTILRGNFDTAAVDFFGSPAQFKQVYWNIVRNALKAMPEGGALTIDFLREGKNSIRLRFADTGVGITGEDQARIFEPFFSKFEGGLGLGMAVVKKVISDYQGQIGVVSEPTRGTEISITLPLRVGKSRKKE